MNGLVGGLLPPPLKSGPAYSSASTQPIISKQILSVVVATVGICV